MKGVERDMIVFRCLKMAWDELVVVETKTALVSIAVQYGRSVGLTEEECEKVLDMKVKDIFLGR